MIFDVIYRHLCQGMLKYFLSTLKIENRYRYLLHSAMTEKINLKREIANLETYIFRHGSRSRI